MTSRLALLHLSLYEKIGPTLIQRLTALGLFDLCEIYQWTARDWILHLNVVHDKAAQLVEHLSSTHALERELASIERANAQFLTLLDREYPHVLRTIHAPPPVLYYRGSLETLNNQQALAIIGSRAANNYGVRIIKTFVPSLVDAGFVIVSGGALGADSMAHKETLAVRGKTIAVLGSGLLHLYPRTNVRMFEDIIAHHGVVVTPFPMNIEAMPYNFPARNRIIAGLSRGCLVVQAAEKSGTRITANFALQQGREVFVVPGQFDDPLSAGCHASAREGATLVTSAHDILYELGMVNEQIQQQSIVSEHTLQNSNQPLPDNATPAVRIKAALRVSMSVEELATQLGLEPDLIQQQLWDLQWQGAVQQDFTGRWEAIAL